MSAHISGPNLSSIIVPHATPALSEALREMVTADTSSEFIASNLQPQTELHQLTLGLRHYDTDLVNNRPEQIRLPNHINPLSPTIAAGFRVMLGTSEPVELDHIETAIMYLERLDDLEVSRPTAIRTNSFEDAELPTREWRNQIGLSLCHKINWHELIAKDESQVSVNNAITGQTETMSYATYLFRAVVCRELFLVNSPNLPVLDPKLLNHLGPQLLVETLTKTVDRIYAEWLRIRSPKYGRRPTPSPFFTHGMTHAAEALEPLFKELNLIHQQLEVTASEKDLKALSSRWFRYENAKRSDLQGYLGASYEEMAEILKLYYQ